jgi:mannose-6-phosphate isomerase-like protein (cupin superfamily)
VPVLPAPSSHTHSLGDTRFTSLATPSLAETDVSVWRVDVQPGPADATHRLTRGEVFVVLSGRAAVALGDERAEAGVGDTIVVPAGTDFALAAVGDEPLSALCVLPAGGQAVLGDGEPFTPPWAL